MTLILFIKTYLIINKGIWIYSKDKVLGTKMLCEENYKVVIIMRFLLH